jgi:DNA-directed RNA polymerase specialized sigma24 family protein
MDAEKVGAFNRQARFQKGSAIRELRSPNWRRDFSPPVGRTILTWSGGSPSPERFPLAIFAYEFPLGIDPSISYLKPTRWQYLVTFRWRECRNRYTDPRNPPTACPLIFLDCGDLPEVRSLMVARIEAERWKHLVIDRKGFPKPPGNFVLNREHVKRFWAFYEFAISAARKVDRSSPRHFSFERHPDSRACPGPGFEQLDPDVAELVKEAWGEYCDRKGRQRTEKRQRAKWRVYAGPEDLIQECYLAVMESLEDYEFPPEDRILGAARDAAWLENIQHYIERECPRCGGTGLAHEHSGQPCFKCRKRFGSIGDARRKGAGVIFDRLRADISDDSGRAADDSGWPYSDRDELVGARWWPEFFRNRDSYPEPDGLIEASARKSRIDRDERAVRWAVDDLSIVEQFVTHRRYLRRKEVTQEEIGRELGIDQGGVSRAEARAFEMLRRSLPEKVAEEARYRWCYTGQRVPIPQELSKLTPLPAATVSIVLRHGFDRFRRHSVTDARRVMKDCGTRPRVGRTLSFGWPLAPPVYWIPDGDVRRVVSVDPTGDAFRLRLECGHETVRATYGTSGAICYQCRSERLGVNGKRRMCGGHKVGEIICAECDRRLGEQARWLAVTARPNPTADSRKMKSLEELLGFQPTEAAMNEMEKIDALESESYV